MSTYTVCVSRPRREVAALKIVAADAARAAAEAVGRARSDEAVWDEAADGDPDGGPGVEWMMDGQGRPIEVPAELRALSEQARGRMLDEVVAAAAQGDVPQVRRLCTALRAPAAR